MKQRDKHSKVTNTNLISSQLGYQLKAQRTLS